jgi:hypothetical protein
MNNIFPVNSFDLNLLKRRRKEFQGQFTRRICFRAEIIPLIFASFSAVISSVPAALVGVWCIENSDQGLLQIGQTKDGRYRRDMQFGRSDVIGLFLRRIIGRNGFTDAFMSSKLDSVWISRIWFPDSIEVIIAR